MIATNLKTAVFVDLSPDDVVSKGLDFLSANSLRHIVIVDSETNFIALLDEEVLLGADDMDKLSSLSEHYSFQHCLPTDHVFDVISKMASGKLTLLPIVEEGRYLGSILMEELFHHLASIYSLNQPGSTFIIEMAKNEYSLATIARIVESEGATILSCAISGSDDTSLINVSIKTNSLEVGRLQATLERCNYNVMATYNDEGLYYVLKERYESLMHYLGV